MNKPKKTRQKRVKWTGEVGVFKRPACFPTSGQFSVWLLLARETNSRMGQDGVRDYCVDCTPEYQRKMITQFKCAHPGVSFVTDDDGWIEGRRYRESKEDQCQTSA